MDPEIAEQLKAYEGKLLGIIPPERIRRVKFPRPSGDVVRGYLELEDLTSMVADVLDRFGIDSAIPASVLGPVIQGSRVAGPAVTMRMVPERHTATHAIANKLKTQLAGRDIYTLAEPGDVIVIDASSIPGASNMGGLAAATAQSTKMAGSVVDGYVRDVAGMREMSFPVWSRGITPRTGKFRIELAEVNATVQIGGVQVKPGDLVLADDDGVIVVPVELAETVLGEARKVAQNEAVLMEALKRGVSPEEAVKILPPDKW